MLGITVTVVDMDRVFVVAVDSAILVDELAVSGNLVILDALVSIIAISMVDRSAGGAVGCCIKVVIRVSAPVITGEGTEVTEVSDEPKSEVDNLDVVAAAVTESNIDPRMLELVEFSRIIDSHSVS